RRRHTRSKRDWSSDVSLPISVQPPRLYDLTTLQRECNRLYGFTAQQTLDYLQSLYEKKLATYPRTDSQYITADMQDTVGSLALRSEERRVGKEWRSVWCSMR